MADTPLKPSKMKGVLIKWPSELLEKIDVDASKTGQGRSEWIRQACEERLHPMAVISASAPVSEPVRPNPSAESRGLKLPKRSTKKVPQRKQAVLGAGGKQPTVPPPPKQVKPASAAIADPLPQNGTGVPTETCQHEVTHVTGYGTRICDKCGEVVKNARRR